MLLSTLPRVCALPVFTLCVMLSVRAQYVPHMPPFFFLCNYHGKPQQSNLDSGEVAISVSIAGNPENYRPEGSYEGEWKCEHFVGSFEFMSSSYVTDKIF